MQFMSINSITDTEVTKCSLQTMQQIKQMQPYKHINSLSSHVFNRF